MPGSRRNWGTEVPRARFSESRQGVNLGLPRLQRDAVAETDPANAGNIIKIRRSLDWRLGGSQGLAKGPCPQNLALKPIGSDQVRTGPWMRPLRSYETRISQLLNTANISLQSARSSKMPETIFPRLSLLGSGWHGCSLNSL